MTVRSSPTPVVSSGGTAMRTRRRRTRRRQPTRSAPVTILLATTAVVGLAGCCRAESVGTDASEQNRKAEDAVERDYFDISDWDDTDKEEVARYATKINNLRDHVKWPWSLSEGEQSWLSNSGFSFDGAPSDGVEFGEKHVARRRLQASEGSTKAMGIKDIRQMESHRFYRKGDVAKIGLSIRGGEKNPPIVNKKANGASVRQNTKDTFLCYDDDPDLQVPCPPDNFGPICDKSNSRGSFRDCYEICKPSFCCIHDSLSKNYSPSCVITEPNCPSYFPCYIVWWKLHDTIGPANYLRTEQDEPFYDMPFVDIRADLASDNTGPFSIFHQFFGHHFDTDDEPTDATFEDPDNW